MKTVRRPPYPKWNPGYFPCSSLIPLPLSSRCPSVSFGGFGLRKAVEGLRVGHLMVLLQIGSMPKELTMKNTELFAKEVLPTLKTCGTSTRTTGGLSPWRTGCLLGQDRARDRKACPFPRSVV